MGKQQNRGFLGVGQFLFLARGRNRFRGVLLHKLGQPLHILHRRFGQNTVTQVEDVSGAPGGTLQNVRGSRLEFFPIGKQQDGIEIALNRAPLAELLPSFVERNAPIEANHFRAGLLHRRQQRRGFRAKVNDGCTGFLQRAHQFGWCVEGRIADSPPR